ncbi:hypothetical protein MBLNU459_g8163t1 [Dothideomycetes sp. NU459]
MLLHQALFRFLAIATAVGYATPVSNAADQASVVSQSSVDDKSPHLITRDIVTAPGGDDNDDSGDETPVSVNLFSSGGTSKSYVSSPATWDGKCVWTVPESGSQFTSRLHVVNASWSNGNFSKTNANGRYFWIYNDTHEAIYRSTQVAIGGLGNLQLIANAVPATSTETMAVSGQIRTGWDDVVSGSIRTVAKGATNPGAVYGIFFYNDNLYQEYETDIELLTTWPNNVSVTKQYFAARNEKQYRLSQTNLTLSGDGSISDWHEYRIDWIPGSVTFFIDGVNRLTKKTDVPSGPGTWIWSSWR